MAVLRELMYPLCSICSLDSRSSVEEHEGDYEESILVVVDLVEMDPP